MRRNTWVIMAVMVFATLMSLPPVAVANVGGQEVVMQTDTATNTTTPTATATPQPGEDPPDEPQSAGELWDNYRAFVTGVVLGFAAIGLWGRSMTVGAFLAYLAFAYITIQTGTVLFVNILHVSIVLVFLGFAFKLWRLEFGGE